MRNHLRVKMCWMDADRAIAVRSGEPTGHQTHRAHQSNKPLPCDGQNPGICRRPQGERSRVFRVRGTRDEANA